MGINVSNNGRTARLTGKGSGNATSIQLALPAGKTNIKEVKIPSNNKSNDIVLENGHVVNLTKVCGDLSSKLKELKIELGNADDNSYDYDYYDGLLEANESLLGRLKELKKGSISENDLSRFCIGIVEEIEEERTEQGRLNENSYDYDYHVGSIEARKIVVMALGFAHLLKTQAQKDLEVASAEHREIIINATKALIEFNSLLANYPQAVALAVEIETVYQNWERSDEENAKVKQEAKQALADFIKKTPVLAEASKKQVIAEKAAHESVAKMKEIRKAAQHSK